MNKLPYRSRKNTCVTKRKRRQHVEQISTSESSRTCSAPMTYSTSAIANGKATKSHSRSINTTEDTLSMISTPWSTDYNSYASSIKATPIPVVKESSESILPKSTSSFGALTPDVASTKTTITLYNVPSVATEPPQSRIHLPTPKMKHNGSLGTFNSWTMETFTSNGIFSNCQSVKPNYPWSPSTVFSGTDLYPTSAETLVSRKGSRESLGGFGSVASDNKMGPMNYANTSKSEEDFILDWILIKAKGVPIIWNYH